MKIKSILLIFIISLLLSGCGIGVKSYEIFEQQQNAITNNTNIYNSHSSIEFYSQYYIQKDYNDDKYIYIRNNYKRKVSEKCIYGHLAKKNDPKQKVIGWKILSGKEYCKQQQQWILSF
ncbi:hypothetical protein [Halarcobacter bivalviorum]|uniref:Lipoprotein n=1 Tax=Halarcobacter bivalviorum TaxID=663364 RepID=A0AAX2A6U0_9BACT|nr:hypothetical protein [Halarcobacter bivalviorum]AXH11276.1 hypothetical protein ABIV_0241 [Halarcobacter bivalviorum]RXK09545.1 hypothetical protein CRV05_09575 [Halarcobacter bivalviorum]